MSTFKELFQKVKKFYQNPIGLPHAPEIWYMGNGDWRLESGLYDDCDVLAKVDLETFQNWYFAALEDKSDFTDQDEQQFFSDLKDWGCFED